MNTLRFEALFGTRWLLRDNWLCERMVRNLRRHEAMSREEMEALSLASLHKTLTAAITRLPYYRRVPRNFPVARAAEVLRERFPVVTKETLLENRDKLYPNAGNPRMWYSLGKTSGTTGTPLSVFRSSEVSADRERVHTAALGMGRFPARDAARHAAR